jgi:hypothetical protein
MGLTKIIVNIPNTIINDLYYLANRNNTSLTAQIIESIKMNKFLIDKKNEGCKILVETPDGAFHIINRE